MRNTQAILIGIAVTFISLVGAGQPASAASCCISDSKVCTELYNSKPGCDQLHASGDSTGDWFPNQSCLNVDFCKQTGKCFNASTNACTDTTRYACGNMSGYGFFVGQTCSAAVPVGGYCCYQNPNIQTVPDCQAMVKSRCDDLPGYTYVSKACNQLNFCPQAIGNTATSSTAQTGKTGTPYPTIYTFNVPIPGLDSIQISSDTLARYLGAFYVYFIGVIGILAVVMIMYGGFHYIVSLGNPSRMKQGKEIISGALVGLMLALTSYLLLRTINPSLVSISTIVADYTPTVKQLYDPGEGDMPSACPSQSKYTAAYGSTRAQIEAQLVTVTYTNVPLNVTKTFKVNRAVAPKFQAVFDAIKDIPYDITRDSSGGTYNWRVSTNNSKCLSLHSFGIAIDINPDKNPQCQKSEQCFKTPVTDIPTNIVKTFIDNGFSWGGEWKSVHDYMHFEVRI